VKDQYFGDVNDCRKYGLLRLLQSNNESRLLVAWMLTPDDGGYDGRLRSYLGNPERWQRYDHQLFAGLSSSLRAHLPSVSIIERVQLLPRASYYSKLVPDGRREREIWFGDLLARAQDADLVFLDPDNGIEVESTPIGRRNSSKYVAWSEITDLWQADCSILVYQHFPRRPREAFSQRLVRELQARTGACFVEAFLTPHVLFLLAAQERHQQQVRDAIALLQRRWPADQIRPMGLTGLQFSRPRRFR
jgi:hypothetical protein